MLTYILARTVCYISCSVEQVITFHRGVPPTNELVLGISANIAVLYCLKTIDFLDCVFVADSIWAWA